VALGFQKGAFTAPRRIVSIEDAAEKVAGWFEGMIEVPCKPLPTQPEAAALLECAFMLVADGEFDEETAGLVAVLREWLEFWSFLLSDLADPAQKPGKCEMYAALLTKARDIERRGYTAMHAIHQARSPLGIVPVGTIVFFPKLTDPGAAKRRSFLVQAEVSFPDEGPIVAKPDQADGKGRP
jgi:hypothetical protein